MDAQGIEASSVATLIEALVDSPNASKLGRLDLARFEHDYATTSIHAMSLESRAGSWVYQKTKADLRRLLRVLLITAYDQTERDCG